MVYPTLLPLMRTPRLRSSQLKWSLRRFKWTRPFRRKTKSGFCACAIAFQLASSTSSKLQLKCDCTRWRTGREAKEKMANGVGSQYPSHYLGTWCIPRRFKWTRPLRRKANSGFCACAITFQTQTTNNIGTREQRLWLGIFSHRCRFVCIINVLEDNMEIYLILGWQQTRYGESDCIFRPRKETCARANCVLEDNYVRCDVGSLEPHTREDILTVKATRSSNFC